MLTANSIEKSVFWACQQEVLAPKPGNVNGFSDHHGMVVDDFINSAAAIAPIMAQAEATVGELIVQAISATRKVVSCNTNLGIVLLFAPLCSAVRQCDDFQQLPNALDHVLQNLTITDAKQCYQAIRLADPGGMGVVAEHDIKESPAVTLKQAMQLAAKRDSIAAQYLNNYAAIWCTGLPNLTAALNRGESIEWASAFAYLMLLAELPDTLIIRKHGATLANEVSTMARNLILKIKENNRLSDNEDQVLSLDKELKEKQVNPGTTADLTAATLLVYALQREFSSNRILTA